jgi:hypothetical protein
MPFNKPHKFRTLDEVQGFLNGALRGANIQQGVRGLKGKTLTFTSPAGAVTFGDSSQSDTDFFLFKDIKLQIETAIPALRVGIIDSAVTFTEASPANGVALSSNNEEAKRLLGFNQTQATAANFYAPPGDAFAAPCWTFITAAGDNQYLVLTWE